MRTVTLKAGSSKPLWMGHPWVFADRIERVDEGEDDWVRVADSRGKVVGRGWWSPRSTIRVRIVDRGEEGPPEADVLATRIAAAVALRRRLFLDPTRTDAYRLVHAEGDGLPGLVVDRFGPVLVAQFATRPLLARRAAIAPLLLAASGARSLVARPGGKEEEEGIAGDEVAFAAGEPAPERVEIVEEGLRLSVDLRRGQKTGHYVDQRENRRLVASAAAGARVLDLYAGTGGFGLRALLAGAAHATAVDSSGPALEGARENAARNGVLARYETVEIDAMEHLATLARAKTEYDVVVVDPPRFARHAGRPRPGDRRLPAAQREGPHPRRAGRPPRDVLLLGARRAGAVRGDAPRGRARVPAHPVGPADPHRRAGPPRRPLAPPRAATSRGCSCRCARDAARRRPDPQAPRLRAGARASPCCSSACSDAPRTAARGSSTRS